MWQSSQVPLQVKTVVLLITKTIWLNVLVGRVISSATPVNVPFNASYAMQSFSKEPISDVMQNKNINWTRSESPTWIKMSTTRTSIRTTKICFQISSDRCTRDKNITSQLKNCLFQTDFNKIHKQLASFNCGCIKWRFFHQLRFNFSFWIVWFSGN